MVARKVRNELRKVGLLVLDMQFYPRAVVDGTHAGHIAEAMEAGVTMPPIIIDEQDRIIDGAHRARAWRSLFGEDYEVAVEVRTYANDGDRLLDAITLNADHGRNITTCDRVRCLLLAEQYGLDIGRVAGALRMTPERIGELRIGRTGKVRVASVDGGMAVPLKRACGHMRNLTRKQADAMKHVGGNNWTFHANQLIRAIECDFLPKDDGNLYVRLGVLRDALDGVLAGRK